MNENLQRCFDLDVQLKNTKELDIREYTTQAKAILDELDELKASLTPEEREELWHMCRCRSIERDVRHAVERLQEERNNLERALFKKWAFEQRCMGQCESELTIKKYRKFAGTRLEHVQ
jgi:hypothetical protein